MKEEHRGADIVVVTVVIAFVQAHVHGAEDAALAVGETHTSMCIDESPKSKSRSSAPSCETARDCMVRLRDKRFPARSAEDKNEFGRELLHESKDRLGHWQQG